MAGELELAYKEVMRAQILRLCQAADPAGCSRQVLTAAMEKEGYVEGVDRELLYLERKGLIKPQHVENKRLGIARDIYMITAEGMDYLDGTGPDIPGIGV